MALWRALDNNKRGAARRDQAPAKRKNRPTKPQRRADKGVAAKPLGDRLCDLARRRYAAVVVFGVFGIPSCGCVLYRAYDGLCRFPLSRYISVGIYKIFL